MNPLQFDQNTGNYIIGHSRDFVIEDLKSGLWLSGPQVEELRKLQGFELIHKQKIRYILPWLYIFRKWSSIMNRFIYLHQIWNYYEEVITSCCIYFDGNEDAENDIAMNEAFLKHFILGKYQNVGRSREQWQVCGKMYDVDDEALFVALKSGNQDTLKIFEAVGDYYKLPSGDYLSYDEKDEVCSLRIVDEKTYRINMLSKFERREAWDAELRRSNEIMKSSPKYNPW